MHRKDLSKPSDFVVFVHVKKLLSAGRVLRNPTRRSFVVFSFLIFFLLISFAAKAQTPPAKDSTKVASKKWSESFTIRGYAQARYNRLLETNPNLECEQCDRSWGANNGFFLRRVRIIFSGQINERVYFYIQPDFASSVSSTSLNFGQLRDAYFDIGIDKKNEFRFRVGQSKIPFGFENMQSSQNRIPLDRNDGLNSALSNERDLGAFFYWAPESTRSLFSSLVRDGLKGSGDYGVFGFGFFNGQTANRPELNDNRHVVARLSYPFRLGSQIIETGIQGYSGYYVLGSYQLSPEIKTNTDRNYLDQRAAASFVLYPQPFGIQAEYNVGRGPEFNNITDSVELQKLHGGYITLSYVHQFSNRQVLIPFTRAQYYDGGKKHETDARSHTVKELEIGVEWQPFPQFELVAMYTMSSRRFEDYVNQNNIQSGSLLRLQAQVNF